MHTSLSPQSLSVAPVLSVFVVLLGVASPLSHSRWETWGHTHQPMESAHLRMKTGLISSPNIATHSPHYTPLSVKSSFTSIVIYYWVEGLGFYRLNIVMPAF